MIIIIKNIKQINSIMSGEDWYDTEGRLIEAHDISIIKSGNTYYWIGTDRHKMNDTNCLIFEGLNMYKSDDLVNWEFVGKALSPVEDVDSDLYLYKKVERPSIV